MLCDIILLPATACLALSAPLLSVVAPVLMANWPSVLMEQTRVELVGLTMVTILDRAAWAAVVCVCVVEKADRHC